MIRVYIESPYTIGDTAINVKFQMDVADKLMNEGYAPFVPLYSHFQHLVHPRPENEWITIDFEWVTACNCLLRLGGESKGADGEVVYAEDRGIPVFYSIEQLLNYYNNEEYELR